MEKINIESFNNNNLLAKLLMFQRNFKVDNFNSNEELLSYCAELVKENFVYPANIEARITNNLALFLLGKPSIFDVFTNL